jgi:hypothetical protein
MSIGPGAPILSGAPAAPLAQTRGKELDRQAELSAQQAHRLAGERAAELASGIGETDGQNHHATERDADGRRPWEIPLGSKNPPTAPSPNGEEARGKDPSGRLGQLLDLLG